MLSEQDFELFELIKFLMHAFNKLALSQAFEWLYKKYNHSSLKNKCVK